MTVETRCPKSSVCLFQINLSHPAASFYINLKWWFFIIMKKKLLRASVQIKLLNILMSLLCWTFQFIMQLFDMKTFFWNGYFISVWSWVQQVLVLDPTSYFTQKSTNYIFKEAFTGVDVRSLHFNWQVVEGNSGFNKCHGMPYLTWSVSTHIFLKLQIRTFTIS